jgi:D-beta-D-heptose 7-phosphate kinase/D-beta-D-heptose 1-phosphate adenosyltransferase
MDGVSVIILSDYAKGVCPEAVCQAVITAARERNVPVLVDPKGRNWQRYRGATAISPNRAELSAICEQQLSSSEHYFAAARAAIAEYDLAEMLLTMSEEGMARITPDAETRVPALAREVFDVSGAGDTSIATYAASLAAGLDGATALRLANVAAGIVVGKVGTVPVSRDDLLVEMLAESERQAASKICTMDQVLQRVALWRARGETMVFTNGCFDILHAGHVFLPRRCPRPRPTPDPGPQ